VRFPLCVSNCPAATTRAGTGLAGDRGDDGPAAQAELSQPDDLAVDLAGNIYIADVDNHRIRRIDASGAITTFAGTGVAGDSGDGGPATEAQLSLPRGVAVDTDGNVYIADEASSRIRRVDQSGVITTVAGTGAAGFSGDGGPATEAQLSAPTGVSVDAPGNLFIADRDNHRVRKVDAAGIIATLAGNGAAGFGGDGGPAAQAQLAQPRRVLAKNGLLYIADSANHRVRKVDAAGKIITIAGTGSAGYNGDGIRATDLNLSLPAAVAVDSTDNLYIAEQGGHRIRQVDPDGTMTTVFGITVDGFDGDRPTGLALSPSGSLLYTDVDFHRVRELILP
jgi:sugar lactone lactonase YvrE